MDQNNTVNYTVVYKMQVDQRTMEQAMWKKIRRDFEEWLCEKYDQS